MPDDAPEGAHEADANRDLWTRVSADYADEHAFRAWASNEITWGIFNIPETQLDVLGEVSGLDVAELGCGTAYFSAWLARRGARPVGVDLTPAQLTTAAAARNISGSHSRSWRLTPDTSRSAPAASTWLSPSAAPACGATLPAGSPKRPGSSVQAGDWYSTPPASCWPCASPA
jgi:Methyltransferase domain